MPRKSRQKSFKINQVDFQNALQNRLELPRAILLQLRETCLFNGMVEDAIADIDELLSYNTARFDDAGVNS